MTVLVAGSGGFIGGHLVASLLADGASVRGVDIKPLDQWHQVHTGAENTVADLRLASECRTAVAGVDDIYNLAADMGGIGFIEQNKALCMLNVLINTHLLEAAVATTVSRYFFSSSACVYPSHLQDRPGVTSLAEADALPAMPEDGYGWEKLFSERMCRHFAEDFGLETRVARFHNVYGPHGEWDGGREKAPAAICRKVAIAAQSGDHTIPVWGDGQQTRSFLFVDDCIEGVRRLMESRVREPVNIGSEDLISINDLTDLVAGIANIEITREHDLTAPQGVRGRNSDNNLVRARLAWEPSTSLADGMAATYGWIAEQVSQSACR